MYDFYYLYNGYIKPKLKMAFLHIKTFFLNWFGPTLLGISFVDDPHSLKGAIIFIVGLCTTLIRVGFWAYRAIQNNKFKDGLKILQDLEIERQELDIMERRRRLDHQ